MADQELEMLNSIVEKTVKFFKGITTFKEQFRCFICCYVLFPQCTLSSIFMIWFLYYSLSIVFTLLRHELNISPAGWKEKCTLKKCGMVTRCIIVEEFGYEIEDLFANLRDFIRRKALRLLGVNDPVVPEELNQISKLTGLLEQSRTEIEELKKATDQLRFTLDESRAMEAELALRNDKLFNKLCASKAECNKLHESLIEALASKQDLEDDKFDMVEQHELEIFKLYDIIEDLEIQKNELFVKHSVARNNAENMHALLSEYKEQNEVEKRELNDTVKELESGMRWLEASLSVEAATVDGLRERVEEYKEEQKVMEEANERLKHEKDELVMNLQMANELVEFHKTLLDRDYDLDYEVV